MLISIIILLAGACISAYLLILLYEFKLQSRIKHIKTNSLIPLSSITDLMKCLILKKNFYQRIFELSQEKGPLFVHFFGDQYVVTVAAPELAKKVLFDTKIFEKAFPETRGQTVLANHNLFVLNGERWKHQRSILAPPFVSLIFISLLLKGKD